MLVAMLLALAPGDTAQPVSFFSRTCTSYQSTEYCASLGATVLEGWYGAEGEGPYPYALWADLGEALTSGPFHTSAFALFSPTPVQALEQWTTMSGWGGSNPLAAPEGYFLYAALAAGNDERWYITGEGYSGDANGWTSTSPDLPAGLIWAWRAENEDGSVLLDCYQNAPCGSAFATFNAGIVTPEPSTWIMLGTGLLLLTIARVRRIRYTV